uniref:Lipid A biosynthesis acyltransferase n=1 Tax=candidate division WOR-3 bacterium TaxID=2052148 RepID=A0A7V3ZVZ4_UNCW3
MSFKTILKKYLMYLGILMGTFLPRWFCIFLAKIIGYFCFLLMKNQRKRMIKNYFFIFGNEINKEKARRLTKELFINLAICVADFLKSPSYKKEQLFSLIVNRVSKDFWEDAKKGRLILATLHLGNWELGGITLSRMGLNFSCLIEILPFGMSKVFNWLRKKSRLKPIPYNSLKEIIKTLERGDNLAILADRSLNRQGLLLPFGKGKRIFPKGASYLAQKYKVPLYFGYFVLNKNGKKYLMIDEKIKRNYYENEDFEREVERLTQIIAEKIFTIVKKYPSQWFVFQGDWENEEN